MQLFDSHLHLDDAAFEADRDAVVARARAAGVVGMVSVGTGVVSSRAAIGLAEKYPEVFATVAIHPLDAHAATDDAMEALRMLAAHPKVVAIGETGLDFSRPDPPREVQREAFGRHIHLSRDLGLPLIIHCREAYEEVLGILQAAQVTNVIMHAFAGSVPIADTCVANGYAISLAGPVTFRNARVTADVARTVPLGNLLVETDAPGLAPEPFRGRRNEPGYLVHTVARIAALRDLPPDDVAHVTTQNARHIYGMR